MQNQQMVTGTAVKICPYCGCEVSANVQKCGHCGEWLNKPPIKGKSFKVTICLSYFLGILGIHRFYTGYIGIGIIQLFTMGGLGLWSLIDLISIALNKYKDKSGKELQGYNKILGIILLILGLLFFLCNGNPYKLSKDFIDGFNATESTSQSTSTSQSVQTTETLPNTQKTKSSATERKRDLEVIEHHVCTDEFGLKEICGTVVNNTNRTIGYAQIEINLYDSDNSLIDSTLDNINNLEPNGKWKFKAPVMEDNVSTYKIKDVTGF